MRKNYLKEYQPTTYNVLLLSEKLYPHCREVQQIAENRLDSMMSQLMKRDPSPDKALDGHT